MEMEKKFVSQVCEGDILGKDIIVNNSLLLKAGTVLHSRIIVKLKKIGIKELFIRPSTPEQMSKFSEITQRKQHQSRKKGEETPSNLKSCMSELFYQTIKDLVFENRYGLAVNSKGLLDMIVQEFEDLMNVPVVSRLLTKMKEWDYFTFYHMVDTFIFGTVFFHYLGLPHKKQFAKGCLLHDIGKMSIPRELIQKNDRLTSMEFEMIKLHTILGAAQLNESEITSDVAYLARQHHERLDGSGYPDGLVNSDLNEEVRALMIIDVYSAMTLKRSYRAALDSEEALKYLLRGNDQFDQVFVREFMSMLHIFPNASIVTLSDLSKARVIEVPKSFPYLPILQRLETEDRFQIPLDLSISISHFGDKKE